MSHRLNRSILTRPWHWGIAILADATLGGHIPPVDSSRVVTGNAHSLIILVRHAEDIPTFDGDFDWAEATIGVSLWDDDPGKRKGHVIFDDVIETPSGRLSIGDADDDVVITACPGLTRVVVSVIDPSDLAPKSVRIDLWPHFASSAH